MPKKSVVNLTRLKELMQAKGWGYGELATYSGVKYDTVYSLAKARRPNSNIATLKQIAAALDVSVDYLLGESDDPSPPEGALPQAVRHLVDVATQLPAMRQEDLLRIAEALAGLEHERDAQTGRDSAMVRLRRVQASVEKEFGEDVRIELDKILHAKGLPLSSGV